MADEGQVGIILKEVRTGGARRGWLDIFTTRIMKLPEYFILLLMVIILFDLILGTASRYLGGHAIPWVEELGTYCFLWLVFLGSAVGVMKETHFVIPLSAGKRSPRMRYLLRLGGCLAIFIFSLLMIVSGVRILKVSALSFSQTFDVPLVIPFASLPVGGALMGVYAIVLMVKRSTDPKRKDS